MEVYLNRIDGIDDAIISMYLSKRTLTRELEERIRNVTDVFSRGFTYGKPRGMLQYSLDEELWNELSNYLKKLFKWGTKHITMLKFIDLSFTVYGMHRGAQDDFDSHAKRMDNRIIRSSTRLASFENGEKSEYYDGLVIPTDEALSILKIDTPDEITVNGLDYVRGVNGYILKGMENNNDVKRGLYMLSIPSNFIFRINLAEFAHVYKQRNRNSTANPELKNAVELMASALEEATLGFVTRDLLLEIEN